MKPLENHRIITLAIGIFVAIVIALTVFTRTPADTSLSQTISQHTPAFTFTKFVEAAVKVIF